MTQPLIHKIVSGGQTGADRAALDAAIETGREYGGWLPKGRKAEDGPLSDRYVMQEMESKDYRKRTEQNVIDSDGTVIFSHGELHGGSLLTLKLAKKNRCPHLHIDCNVVSEELAAVEIEQWIRQNNIKVVNVAGPRASGDEAIYAVVKRIISRLMKFSG